MKRKTKKKTMEKHSDSDFEIRTDVRGSLAGVMTHSRCSFHSHNEPILTYTGTTSQFYFRLNYNHPKAGRSADTSGVIIRTIIANCFSRIDSRFH